MDIVYIRDLRAETVIGVFEWERSIRQQVSLDIEIAYDIQQAATTDALEFTLDYDAVAKRVIAMIEQSQFQLIETLIEHVAKLIIEEFMVPWVRCKLSKLGAVREAASVGVVIERCMPGAVINRAELPVASII